MADFCNSASLVSHHEEPIAQPSGNEEAMIEACKRLTHSRTKAILERAHSPQYHMGSYGTFGMDTVHGRLFELGVEIDSLKTHTMYYFAFVVVALTIWPIAAFVAFPVAYTAGKNRDFQVFKVLLVLSTIIGATLWFIPILIVCFGGGINYFQTLIFKKKDLNLLDFIDFFLSELMILLLVVFALVYHHIALDVESYKRSAVESWHQHHSNYGVDVFFPDHQLKRMLQVLKEDCNLLSSRSNLLSSRSSSPCHAFRSARNSFGAKTATTLHLEEIVRILETLPGWDTYDPELRYEIKDHNNHIRQVETGLFNELVALEEDAMEKNLWPIDIWLVKTQWYPEDEMDLKEGMLVAYYSTYDLLGIVATFTCHHRVALVVFAMLALVRTFLPRVWLWYGGGELLPTEGASALVVAFSAMVSFSVSFFWLALFFFILMEYRRNLCQVVLLTGLVDARMRVQYSQYFLMSSMWFCRDSETSEAVLGKMPLLDLRISSNAAAFWHLREYASLDRANERMAISILLEIVIIWLLLEFVSTLVTMYISTSVLPANLVVTVFDLCVFGGMLVISLKVAVDINSVVNGHKQVFVEAKYECTMAIGEIHKESTDSRKPSVSMLEGRKSSTVDDSRVDVGDKRKDLELSRKLLNEYLDMCIEGEYRDHILFGMHVTPAKIFSFAATVATMIYTLLQHMVKHGQLKVSGQMEDGFISGTALHVVSSAVSSLLQFNGTSHLFQKE